MTKSCSLLYRRRTDYISWCAAVFQCSLSLSTAGLGRWTSPTFRLALTRPRLSAGASVVLQRCVKKGQHTGSRAAQGFRQQRERERGVRPRADQSKHTNETLIGLLLPVLAVCTEFSLLLHTGVHLILPCQQVLWQCMFSECVFFFFFLPVLLVCSFREIRNAKSLTYIDPEAFKNLPNLKYLWVFFTACSLLKKGLLIIDNVKVNHKRNDRVCILKNASVWQSFRHCDLFIASCVTVGETESRFIWV